VEPEKRIAYVREADTLAGIGKAWDTLDIFINSSKQLMSKEEEYLGICHDMPKAEDVARDQMRYDAVVTVIGEIQPSKGVSFGTLPGGRYAVFLHEGPLSQLEKTWNAIYTDWLPSSGEKLRNDPPYEKYNTCPAETDPANLRTEIYIPLK